ncbi:DUF5361 domain-containing protein [Oceanobacillus indicireducens]|uniref:DUF5361 domain-containing protein n=1 Tax=Oceanobacillus indicireducens TaxID=1004261 RepID=UPI001E3C8B60|nr:DUF5361 domain-containing protein [Oceanobacillus indicireducens]
MICDLAETYQIYDYRQLPTTRVAVFACGLRDDSRIKMKLSGQLVPMDTLLLAGISDKLSMLVWFQTEDGQKGKNRPTSLINLLTNSKEESKKDVVVFDSGEDFVKTRNQLMVGGE